MALSLVLTLCLCGIFCLTPLGFYLVWLASVNRRPRPTVIAGGWDFAALLAGLSGFLVFGGGVLVAGVQSNVRVAARGNWEQIQAAWGQDRLAWTLIALGYVGAVGGAVAAGLIARSRTLAVYNIDREAAEAVVGRALGDAGVSAERFGDLWSDGRGVVAIDAQPGFRHATLRLVAADPRLREEVARGLRKHLAAAPAADGAAARPLTSAAVTCLFTVLSCLLLMAYFVYLTR